MSAHETIAGSGRQSRVHSVERLIAARAYFRAHPEGKISTGLRDEPKWDRARFEQWLRSCLHAKINRLDTRKGRKLSPEWQSLCRRDARTVNDYYARRIRHSGSRNLLEIPELQRRYPHVNTQPHPAAP